MKSISKRTSTKWMAYSGLVALTVLLSACGSNNAASTGTSSDTTEQQETDTHMQSDESNSSTMNTESSDTSDMEGEADDQEDSMDMQHNDMNEPPDDMKAAVNPTFPLGSQVTIESDHMDGMKGAKATISGAYDTTVYSVSYTPTTGGQPVKDHKWVVHEEIEDATAAPYKVDDQVVLDADHMKGMDGAKATIDSAQQTTVYMVDYTPTDSGQPVKNHMWLTGDELSANK